MAVPFYMAGMEICMNKKKKKLVRKKINLKKRFMKL